jgi:uncharacterized membrane protein
MNANKTRKVLSLKTELILIYLPGGLLVGLVGFGVQGFSNLLGWLRLTLGLLYILLVPGYTLLAALFPRADSLTGTVRLALSISLSVAVIPIIALLLDSTPWGLRLWPVVISEASTILLFSLAALVRRARLPRTERFLLSMEIDLKGWWFSQDKGNRIVVIVMLGIFVAALSSAAAILLLPKPGEHFTEFYILGPEGLAENYPRQIVVGEPVTVTIGLTNLEAGDRNYRVEVWAIDPWEGDRRQMTAEIKPFTLPADQTFEYPLTWTMPWEGEDQQVEFYLLVNGQPEPYRKLRIWLDVIPSDG